jgi:signal transduction histidine kinase
MNNKSIWKYGGIAAIGIYIFLQFSWWAWMLIELHGEVEGKQRMVLGEGVVFFILLSAGLVLVWRRVQETTRLAEQERNFMLAITHELKTPVAAIRLAIETIEKHNPDEATHKLLLRSAQAGTVQLERRIDDVLQSAQIRSNAKLGSEPFDLEEVLEGSVRRIKLGRHSEREVVVQYEGELGGLMEGDPKSLALAWTNVIENALKYSPSDSVVTVWVRRSEHHIEVIIDDAGPGIPAAERKNVVQPFRRLGDESRRENEGTGLGLYLADQTIRLHRGRLNISESPAGGTRISTRIPCH